MVSNLVDRLNRLDDFQVVRFFNHFSQQLFEGMDVTKEQVLSGIPPSIRELPGFSRIESLSPEERKAQLESSESVAIARSILVNLAQDATFSPLVERALDTYKDDKLFAGAILAIGAAASMILVAATTQAKGKVFGIELVKEKANPDLVKAILEPFSKALTKLFGATPA